MASKTEKDRLAFEAAIRANAVAYRVHLFLGRGQYDRADAATLAEAIDLGRRMKEARPAAQAQPMFYAIEKSGHATVITPSQFQEEINVIKTEVIPTLDATRAAEAEALVKRAKKAEAERQRRANKKAASIAATSAPEAGKADVAITICPPSQALRELQNRRERINAEAERRVAESGDGDSVEAAPAAKRGHRSVAQRIADQKTDLKKRKPAKSPKAAKAEKPAEARGGDNKGSSKKAEALAAAHRGEVPGAPDFSADTHKRWRKALEEVVALVEAGDIAGLKANTLQPASSSRAIICRYRDHAIIALEARLARAN